jgi:hypothetical protein
MEGVAFKPGDIVRWFAETQKWSRICKYNIIVEGLHDKNYLELAANLYEHKFKRKLIGDNLIIFPPGIGDQGGTYGIQRIFPVLKQLIAKDTSSNGKPLFRAIALLDNDAMGKRTLNGLTAKYLGFQQYRDIFLLHRTYPVASTRDSEQLRRLIAIENEPWSNMDCVIEDLISWDVITVCCAERPDYFEREPIVINGAHHCKFRVHAKAALFRCVKQYAELSDLMSLVETLKFLRYCLGLCPDGDPV